MNDSLDTMMTGKSGTSYGRYGAYPFQPPGASSVSKNCMFQPDTPRRNFKRLVGILARSRISGTGTVEVVEVGEGCATSISGSAVSSASSVNLAKSIEGILRSTSWVIRPKCHF